MPQKYEKIPLPIHDLAKHLIEERRVRGISCDELEVILQKVGYFRLRGYLYAYRGDPTVEWLQVRSDYELDKKLRSILFVAIAEIEIALRSQLDANLSVPYGIHWYENHKLSESLSQSNANLAHLLASWRRVKNDFKAHFETKYDSSFNPPAWMIFETSSLGTLSKYFFNLSDSVPEKFEIAKFFGFKKSNYRVLKSWFIGLAIIRNLCAHHSRIFSQKFIMTPKIPKNFPKNVPANSIFISILIIAILLKNIGVDCHFVEKIRALLATANARQLQKMGVPANWEEIL